MKYEGAAEAPLKPDRQNETFNGANSFTWCEWSGSRTTGESDSCAEERQAEGPFACTVNRRPLFKFRIVHSMNVLRIGAVESVEIVNNTFDSCTAQNYLGGGAFVYTISTCVRISGCEFQKCKAVYDGGGLFLENFQVSGTDCIPTENEEGGSASVFDCDFTSCSLTSTGGGGMYCRTVPVTFKMRSIQFISCSASALGGGLFFSSWKEVLPFDKLCSSEPSYGDDIHFKNRHNLCLSSYCPFKECFTTNEKDKRGWLKKGVLNRFVAVSGGNTEELCGLDESSACRTICVAVEKSKIQVSPSVTLMNANHTSEATTSEIGSKKISVVGTRKDKSSIGTGVLSFPSSTGQLFSVTRGQLEV
ncbi:uncharacterized protein MONOS_9689 [Monocercomonoides exilis]|uniref:uncharacterized protein n=1 Tax=Monocercomonoides exilis TaxID=2049356 RepID=UPI00355AB8D1|nr:hypothetical protein MONOS_9689 [Monocercomonoides exilis]|eukprot:MONOS_9689.1-p1 / transcript=MONOS_9689.1 / gene=MONOS_9689 / organism=Monocercomonoides_exilis_PA203 / gene_product=unspecified product / transcript_product=unspecified product / location=Mono_scaffold00409:37816-39020(+) / protein_length=361 / sequence_SO=supercontig / SO=protein_coding / is_pseudo=false